MVDLVAGRAGVEVAELVAAAAGDVLAIVVMTGVVRVGSGSRVVKVGMNVVAGVVMTAVRVVRAATTGEVRVVSGSRVVRVVMIAVASGAGRVVNGSRVARAAMTGVVRVVMIEVKTGVVHVGSGSRVVRAATTGEGRVVMTEVVRVGMTAVRVVRAAMTVVVRVVMTAVRDSVMIAMMRQSLRRSSVARRCSRVRARASTAKTNRLPIAKIGMSASSMRARFVASAFGVTNPSARSAVRDEIAEARRFRHRLRLRIHWRGKYGKPLAIGVMTL